MDDSKQDIPYYSNGFTLYVCVIHKHITIAFSDKLHVLLKVIHEIQSYTSNSSHKNLRTSICIQVNKVTILIGVFIHTEAHCTFLLVNSGYCVGSHTGGKCTLLQIQNDIPSIFFNIVCRNIVLSITVQNLLREVPYNIKIFLK